MPLNNFKTYTIHTEVYCHSRDNKVYHWFKTYGNLVKRVHLETNSHNHMTFLLPIGLNVKAAKHLWGGANTQDFGSDYVYSQNSKTSHAIPIFHLHKSFIHRALLSVANWWASRDPKFGATTSTYCFNYRNLKADIIKSSNYRRSVEKQSEQE